MFPHLWQPLNSLFTKHSGMTTHKQTFVLEIVIFACPCCVLHPSLSAWVMAESLELKHRSRKLRRIRYTKGQAPPVLRVRPSLRAGFRRPLVYWLWDMIDSNSPFVFISSSLPRLFLQLWDPISTHGFFIFFSFCGKLILCPFFILFRVGGLLCVCVATCLLVALSPSYIQWYLRN